MTGSDAPQDACNRFTTRAGSCTVLKRSGAEEDVNAAKAVRGMVAAGCPKAVAEEIAAEMPTSSTEAIKDYITAELLRRDKTAAAERYKSYRAGFTSASIKVLRSRYLMRDPDGKTTETPAEMFWRVAACMALPVLGGVTPPDGVHGYKLTKHHLEPYADFRVRSLPKRWSNKAEAHRHFADTVERYQRIMFERRFLPNSPTLMNAGGPLGQLSACFVLDMPDNLPGIMGGVKDATLIFQSGGGVGINYSTIRPAGSPVASTAGVASGPVSFMSIMDRSSEVVKQGGKRRAANMGVLDASHPDIERFISAKREGSALNTFNEVEEISLRSEADPAIVDYLIATHEGPALNNFNISVGTDAEFWNAVASGEDYHGKNAAGLLDKIAESAHDSAEPGVIFFDAINKHNMLEKARGGPLRSTNPCWGGETKVLTKHGPISFRELANGPSKVQVLSREDNGSLSYRTMQNPGITAENAEVVCLVVASKQGECKALRCTPAHKVYVLAGPNVEKRAVETLTPGTSLASLYLEGSIWEQSNGVCTPANEVPEIAMEGTGHPKPSVLPLKLSIRGKGKDRGKAKKKVMADGFATPDGDIPEVQSEEKPKGLARFFRRNNHKVLAVIHLGRTDVYNGVVDTTHNYFVECGDGHYILSGNCGEQALYPNESCNLGSINLAEYVDGDALDWDRLAGDTRLCARMLDGVVDMTRHPTRDIGLASNETRRVGLGVMGVADMLMYLGIPYNSKEAYEMFGRLAEFISYHSMDESVRMAAERGSFPLYSESAYTEGRLPFAGDSEPYNEWEHRATLPWDELVGRIKQHGMRNVLTTTIAPTGTISMIAGCSSGIEPVFSLAYTKKVSVGTFTYGCPALEAKHPDVVAAVAEAGGVMPEGLVDDADVYVTARQIHWADHVLAQSAWQRWVGNSISKTINMAASATVKDVRDAYVLAHRLGCRGITVYRDGSRSTQVLESGGVVDEPVLSDVAAGCLA